MSRSSPGIVPTSAPGEGQPLKRSAIDASPGPGPPVRNGSRRISCGPARWRPDILELGATTRLAALGCGPYNLVRVDVPDPEGRPDARLILELTGPELQLWVDGQLDDGQLAERMRRKLYQTLPFTAPTPAS